ncbi:metal-dependent transcriptional regulator [Natronosalvus halobius]|uniref:metal-dependent transcriptional regulator n=1 Tax=Natronosalvus halobius TaxID=2953746 RepID=UPI00209E5919|nr:metal-dependent transcriptional regulator [Natronosalvus halobius]USZ72229.1 metal-dependent transcriptional regulator [Natronosalvus halobius]
MDTTAGSSHDRSRVPKADSRRERSNPDSTDVLTATSGWYLLGGYWLSGRGTHRVRVGELAERLSVAPASVTEMVNVLADASLLETEPYAGFELTVHGMAHAKVLAWRQCVVATFFDRALSYDLDDETAYRIGYELPGRGLVRLEQRIDRPRERTCRRLADDGTCLVGTFG